MNPIDLSTTDIFWVFEITSVCLFYLEFLQRHTLLLAGKPQVISYYSVIVWANALRGFSFGTSAQNKRGRTRQ